jgi:D-arabinose 1-dehydrogenase-like Zn-dependent alcohol dehydrogenase
VTLVSINGRSLPFAYGSTQQDVQLSTSTLGTREDFAEVIRLARENGNNVNTTHFDLEDVNHGAGRPRQPQNPGTGRVNPLTRPASRMDP